eukprot:TRINITY_DN4612_c0_g2_i1.p1 TRINITY_DN4612_c0_g2~~TRINITY_DN4612_c0_g2_i1.p1  ORF type:complete len:668 (+),score=125.35 TRINITY_DN4612_c0_g2_i1:257-2260(+)
MYEVAEDAVADGIKYIEVRFSPILHTEDGLNLSAVMEAVIEGKTMAECNLPIIIRVIVCGMRHLDSSVTTKLAEICWRYKQKGVTGFDLAGPEFGFSSKYHRKAFGIVRRKGINCTLHSGEAAGWESIQDSIQYCGAHRIGHGVNLKQNEQLLQFVADNQIAVEVCVTSNVHTKAIPAVDQHPIREFFNKGVIVVPCTDNRTVSNCTLTGEYDLLQKTYGFTPAEIVKIIDYGFKVAFMDSTIKRRVRAEVFKDCITILQDAGVDVSDIDVTEYYDEVGMLHMDSNAPYWMNHKNPEITLDLLEQIPIADIHCKFDGGISLDFLYQELNNEDTKQEILQTLGVQFETKEELQLILQKEKHTTDSLQLGKRIIKLALQTEDQIKRGFEDIFLHCEQDNIYYMEIAFRPKTFTKKKLLTDEEALKIAVDSVIRLNEEYCGKVKCCLTVYVSIASDDPIGFMKTAKLAVSKRDSGVITGFGIYGSQDEIPYNLVRYYLSTFNYLKNNNLNVSIYAGYKKVDSIVTALSEGGARRLSGAFQLNISPRLVNYCSNHKVPVEIRLSQQLEEFTSNIPEHMKLMLDSDVPVAICSFRGLLHGESRREMILKMIQKCSLEAHEVMRLLTAGFRYNFQHKHDRDEMYARFKKRAETVFEENGFKFLYRKHYFTYGN